MRLVGCAQHVLPGKFDPADPEMPFEEIWGLDLGSGVWISPFSQYEGDDSEPQSEHSDRAHIGGIVWHVHSDGRVCGGAVHFAQEPELRSSPTWDVVSWDPLTLTPSIRGTSNPDGSDCMHGFITDGRWVSC